MKKQLVITAVLAATACSVFGQGWVTFSTSTHKFYNEFTTPGVGVYGNVNIDYALYWAATGTADPLSAVGSEFGQAAASPSHQMATNGVASVTLGSSLNAILTGAGFTLGLINGGSTVAGGTITAAASAGEGQIQIGGITAGNAEEFIIVGWDAASGFAAIQNGTYVDAGWSNPFNYTTGANSSDPNGTAAFTTVGDMNAFGVTLVATPEPGTMALAALGGASLLLFRRKK